MRLPSDVKASLVARWTAQWLAEDPSFELTKLAGTLDDEAVSLLALPLDARRRTQLSESEFQRRGGARSGCALALALRDPECAELVAWSVCQSHEPAAFDALLSLVIHPGAAWPRSAGAHLASLAVRVFERPHAFAAWRDEPPCQSWAVRLPAPQREVLVGLLAHPEAAVRGAVAAALAYACDPRLDDGALLRDALMAHALDASVGPAAYSAFRRAPDAKHASMLCAHVATNAAWWLLACLAELGDVNPAHAHFDALTLGDQRALLDSIMGRAASNRAFLLKRLGNEATPLALRECIVTAFLERGFRQQVAPYEARLLRAREAHDEAEMQAARKAQADAARKAERASDQVPESAYRVFAHPEHGTWSIARINFTAYLRIVSPDGEVSSRGRSFRSLPEVERFIAQLITEQREAGYVEQAR